MTLVNWCKTALCLRAGCIVEVADERNHESVFYLVNRNVHNLIFLLFYLFNLKHIVTIDTLIIQSVSHLVEQHNA